MKYVNIVIMVLMAVLCVREGADIAQHGASTNVIFFLLFGSFAVRRFMLMSKYS